MSLGQNDNSLLKLMADHALLKENARLAAENERLRKSSFTTAVPSEEYEKVKAENERLRADASEASSLQSFIKWNGMEGAYKEWLDWRAERPVTLTNSKTWQVLGEYAEAKEQIARLEKAGEKMADIVWHIRTPEAHEALHDWNVAKEGRDAK